MVFLWNVFQPWDGWDICVLFHSGRTASYTGVEGR